MRCIFLIATLLIITLPPMTVDAQNEGECQSVYDTAVRDVLEYCLWAENNTACAASGAVTLEAEDGATMMEIGGTMAMEAIALVRADSDNSAWSIASLRLADSIDPLDFTTLLLLGPASLEFERVLDYPPGAAFNLFTDSEPLPCSKLPRPGLLVQAPAKNLALLRGNGVALAINGTAMLHTDEDGNLTVSAIIRETIQGDMIIFSGYSAHKTKIVPFDPDSLAHLPVEVLPRIDQVPLPGSAVVQEQTALHLRPHPEAYRSTLVRAGSRVNIFGQSEDWLMVRLVDGEMGWLSHDVLELDVPGAIPVMDEPPAKPQRPFGPVLARGVTTADTNNLRDGPGQEYAIAVQLPPNAALDIYARSLDDDWLLVETTAGIRAWINVTLVKPNTPFNLEDLPYSPDMGTGSAQNPT